MMTEMIAKNPEMFEPPDLATELASRFTDMRAAVALAEGAIEQGKRDAKARGDAALAKAVADPNHSSIESPVFAPMAQEFWKSEMTFPIFLRQAMFIAIHSHVEHLLLQWCHWLHEEWSLSQGIRAGRKKRGNSTLLCYVLYLRDEAGLNIGGEFERLPEWKLIDAHRLARNCLAHEGGIVTTSTHRRTIESIPHVQVDDSGLLRDEPVIHLLPGACEAAIDASSAFFLRLVALLDSSPKAARNEGMEANREG